MIDLVWLVWFGRLGLLSLVEFGRLGLVWSVRFGVVGLVRLGWIWYIRMGLVRQVGLLVLVNHALNCSHPDIIVSVVGGCGGGGAN